MGMRFLGDRLGAETWGFVGVTEGLERLSAVGEDIEYDGANLRGGES
jgi:hypothetical protein